MKVPESPLLIAEVQDIEIEDSYRKLIGTATVTFPRGTVIKKTVTTVNLDEIPENDSVSAMIDRGGTLVTTRTDSKLAEVSDFAVGDRIQIKLGYVTSPKIAALTKMNASGNTIYNNSARLKEYEGHLTVMFDGYIVKRSVGTPIILKCENLASNLKKISCPNVPAAGNKTVNDFLSEKGKYKLLERSGLKLYPETEACEIDIGKVPLNTDMTVADVLTKWSKSKLFAYVKREGDQAYIAVGRSYFSKPGKDSILNKEPSQKIPEIFFNYHVAEDGLQLTETNKEFLVVEASAVEANGEMYHISLRKTPDYDPNKAGSKPWQVMNEVTISKKAQKAGATVLGKSKDKVDLSRYTVIPYMSRKIGISHDDLLKEAQDYFESYNMNGIEGSLTLFGDYALQTGTKVKLIDTRYPGRNGYYLVDEINTRFGANGYRQTIKLPYLISKEKKQDDGTKS
jgi:hypothetical protein